MSVVLIGTLDTKGEEVGFVRDVLAARGERCVVVDAGSFRPPSVEADVSRECVFEAGGTSVAEVAERGERGFAVARAGEGVARLVRGMWERGELEGVLALGGSAGTSIGTAAMRVLPVGVPKVMVSTLASGQTRPYVCGSDIVMVPAVCDLAGLNRITRLILSNAAHALAGMLAGVRAAGREVGGAGPQLVTATMFGVTTPCVTRARAVLEGAGVEVMVFHATGVGGQAMEGLVASGVVAGVLDLTTTELADEVVGGVLSAGPERLRAAVAARVPQVLSVGALDMVNFGPMESVPEVFRGRLLYSHNPQVTLMRTTREENGRIGAWMAEVLRSAAVPTEVLLPLRGVSALDAPGKPFEDRGADAALFEAIKAGLEGHPHVRVLERDEHMNDPAFAEFAAWRMLSLLKAAPNETTRGGDRVAH